MNKTLLKQSEGVYSLILKFYPKKYRQEFGEEMKFVFLESLKDEYKERGDVGIVTYLARTFLDTGKSIVVQYYEERSNKNMKAKQKDIFQQNKIFAWLALATGAILAIPLLAMKFQWVKPDPSNQFDQGVNWTIGDFLVMGILIFGAGSLFVVIARVIPKKYRTIVGLGVFLAFLFIWAELAVGIFTNLGS